jgi:uncharacterized protein (TIGR02145 family)
MNIFTFAKFGRTLLFAAVLAGLTLLSACSSPLQKAALKRARVIEDNNEAVTRPPLDGETVLDTCTGFYTNDNYLEGARYRNLELYDYTVYHPDPTFKAINAVRYLLERYVKKHPDTRIEELDDLHVRSVKQVGQPHFSGSWDDNSKEPVLKLSTRIDFKGVIVKGGPSARTLDSIAARTMAVKDTFTDSRDGKSYKSVKIGGLTWMAENLNYRMESGSWCYGDADSDCDKYGRLYAWDAAKTACPSGWRLPTRGEWGSLAKVAGGTGDYGGGGTAAYNLKAGSGWNDNGNGTDKYGFSALPGGERLSDGGFQNAGDVGHWWTVTESSAGNAYNRDIYGGYDNVEERNLSKDIGRSVRCVADK